MRCPSCSADYETGVDECPDCQVELVPEGVDVGPALVDIGRFHPGPGRVVLALADDRGIPAEVIAGEADVTLLASEPYAADLRAELVVNWGTVLGQLDGEDLDEVLAGGGTLPGWHDAPEGAWVDKHGRIQVSSRAEEEELEQHRFLGPTLLAGALLLGLLAVYSGPGNLRLLYTLGALALLLIGVFSPR